MALGRILPRGARWLINRSIDGSISLRLHEHWCGQQLISELFPGHGIMSTINGESFEVPYNSQDWYRHFEPVTRDVIARSLKYGSTFVDVGANVGYFSVLASRLVGPTGKVHAFEPAPDTLPILKRNLRKHKARNIELHSVALSDKSGERAFNLTSDQCCSGFVPGPYHPVIKTAVVQQRRLDDVVRGQVDFVKIDIEGTESEALLGMNRIIQENPRIAFLVEWSPACMKSAGYQIEDLPNFFLHRGFTDLRAIDDFCATEVHSVTEMLEIFSSDGTGLRYCNLFVGSRA